MGSNRINRGLFPFVYVGGLLRQSTVEYSGVGGSDKDVEYTGDVAGGFGLDLKITNGFGFTGYYDMHYGPGVGITFNF